LIWRYGFSVDVENRESRSKHSLLNTWMLVIEYQHNRKEIPLHPYTSDDLKEKIKELFAIQQDFNFIQHNNRILVLDSTIQQDLSVFLNTEQDFQSFSTKLKLITK
jgi:hypothetical protein